MKNHLSENEHSHHLSENDHNHLLGAPARTKLPINRQTPDQPCEKHSPGDIGIHLSENESHDIHLSENSHDIHLSENETHSIHLGENGHSNHLNRNHGSKADPYSAFPTASKLRAKQLRKEGYEPTKRRKMVEAHFDDLGDDITGLGGDLPYLFADYIPEYADSESETDGESEVFIANWLRTSRKLQKCEDIDADGKPLPFALVANRLKREGEGVDLCELSGGAARRTVIAIRRRLDSGRNFDLVAEIDMDV